MVSENTIATGTTADWAGEEAITAELNQFKANVNYALMGYTVDVQGGAVRWRGVFSSQFGIGGPADPDDPFFTANFFVWLSERSGKACVPVFNAADAAAVLIDASQDEGGVDLLVTQFFHQLG
jgi:hypothetical protein